MVAKQERSYQLLHLLMNETDFIRSEDLAEKLGIFALSDSIVQSWAVMLKDYEEMTGKLLRNGETE